MRWDAMRINGGPGNQGGAGAPALFERGAVARTFDTPGFRGMTFFEVHARSIINRVPAASRVPFRWTINPYRGCSHACSYCLVGETPILMADGRTRPIAELQAGDAIYGTVGRGSCRHCVVTPVLAHWQTVKPAYLVTLADGTHLVASGDHRFLSDRGWKHVTGTEQGAARRPHLTTGNKLMGVGAFAQPPKQSPEYQRGYLCGMVRGDGHRGSYSYPRGDVGLSWRKGFLAGIFDAAGSYRDGTLRIRNTGPDMLAWTISCLESLRFDVASERTARSGGMTYLRLRGGLRDVLRFFHTTDPVITRKRSIQGVAITSDADLRVTRIEPLGVDLPMHDITTGTGDFIANGVVSHNCFARKTHTYLDFDAGHDFDSKIVVKVNAPELARRELAAPRWQGEHVAMGTNVDCYQRAEGRYQLMPGILAALRDAANPFSILTKGTLILRDLDLLLQASEVTEVGLAVSVGSAGPELWRALESGTPSPQRRLEVCSTFRDNGLACGVLMGPIVPFLSDSPSQLEDTVRQIAQAGAASVSPIILHLRPGAREWFFRWLELHHPELVPRYRSLYGRGSYAPQAYQRRVTEQVRALAKRYQVRRDSPRRLRGGDPGRPGARGQKGSRPGAHEPAAPVQLTLL